MSTACAAGIAPVKASTLVSVDAFITHIQDANSASNGLIAFYTGPASGGVATGSLVLPTGVPFSSLPAGKLICADAFDGTPVEAKMYGYFTADK